VRHKTGTCVDCSTPVLPLSKRCRTCSLKLVGGSGWNRIGEEPMSSAQRQARYRKKHPIKTKAASAKCLRDRQNMVNGYKSDHGCEKCGITDFRVLDLHHRDLSEKEMAVSQMLKRRSLKTIKSEMDKCSVLCANCHRITHAENNVKPITIQFAAAGWYKAT